MQKNPTYTVTWGVASYKNHLGDVIDFDFKHFHNSGITHIEDFSEGDIINLSGKFTYEENSAYNAEGIMVSINK